MKEVFAIICASIFFFSPTFAVSKKNENAVNYQIQAGCSLYMPDGKLIRSFSNSSLCVFFEDGSFAVASEMEGLVMFDREMNVRWKSKLPYPHHHIEFSKINNEILVLSAKKAMLESKSVQVDTVVSFDLAGKINKVFDPSKEYKEFSKKLNFSIGNMRKDENLRLGAKYELYHSNAIHEIPENAAAKKNVAFKAGNYILTVSAPPRVFILDSDLSKVLWVKDFPYEGVHDATINSKGELLVYLNDAVGTNHSEIRKYDLISGDEILKIERLPGRRFYSEGCGGVTELSDGSVFFTEIGPWKKRKEFHGTIHHFDSKGKYLKTIQLKPFVLFDLCVHRIEVDNFQGFLEKNKGL